MFDRDIGIVMSETAMNNIFVMQFEELIGIGNESGVRHPKFEKES
jgi:hypothetical protein